MVTNSSKPLRVAQVTWHYLPYLGGVPVHAYEVATRLAAAGVDVTALSTDPEAKYSPQEMLEGVKSIRVPAWPKQADFYFSPAIYQTIQRKEWDIIHVQGIHTLVAPMAMLAALRAKIPYVMTFHSAGHSEQWRNWIRPIHWAVLRPLLARAKRLIALHQQEATFFQNTLNLPAAQFAVIPNGCDLPQVEVLPEDRISGTLIASVGRLDKLKGHQRVIEALPLVMQEIPDIKYRIIGTGPYEEPLRQLAQELGVTDRVEIKGILPTQRRSIVKILLQSALVAQMSDSENNPIAAMEAISLRCNVLVTATTGLQALADRGLVRSIPLESTPQQVADAIVQQIRNPFVLPEQLGLITWNDCVGQILDVYHQALRV